MFVDYLFDLVSRHGLLLFSVCNRRPIRSEYRFFVPRTYQNTLASRIPCLFPQLKKLGVAVEGGEKTGDPERGPEGPIPS